MHKITFFPLGNADCCRIDLANGRKLLFDYAHTRDEAKADDRRIDLPDLLRRDLDAEERDGFDVVCFTHLDDDNIKRSSEFFFLEHADEYQSDDRIRIAELWVPAAAILEPGLTGEARVIRSEARHRLKEGAGIRVFSRPKALEAWLEENGLSVDDRRHLITDAGQLVPGFNPAADGVEFFVHSPFAHRLESGEVIDRNQDAVVVHGRFVVDGKDTGVLFASDVDYEALTSIVSITRNRDNDDRLSWALVKIPHHCSYTSLSEEKGEDKTQPTEEIAWLYERQGEERCTMVSTSQPIPDEDSDQPPHQQAAAYYREVADSKLGEFRATMSHPRESDPEPLVVLIEGSGPRIEKWMATGVAIITGGPAPRAG